MINAEEHKKLLNQFIELERNSTNYFDVEKEFFLIDSDNLSQVRSKLYGYSIQRTGIYEDDNLTAEAVAGLDGRGCYVFVEVKDGQITVKQDLNGSWGLYLFRHGDYFALSNSFFRLLDHVKNYYPLSINRDYCHYLLVETLTSLAYFETPVNEIELVDKSAVVHIDIAKKTFQTELIDYKEHTIAPDSKEGIEALDRWFEFWCSVYRNTAQRTNFISSQLSGGFDSRIAFIFALNSGVDLSKVRLETTTTKTYNVFVEDYEIASKITAHYGLTLNKPLTTHDLRYSLNDIFNMKRYSLQPFYKDPVLRFSQKGSEKLYLFTGHGNIRGYSRNDPESFIQRKTAKRKFFSSALSGQISDSVRLILKSAFKRVCNKYKINDEHSVEIPQYYHNETRGRVNYGKSMLSGYLRNNIMLPPNLDPIVRTVQLNTQECPDPLLLVTLVFTRYEPDLLQFPFQGNRSIAPETIEYAKKINERFPRRLTTDKVDGGGGFYLQPRDLQIEKILASGRNNPYIPSKVLEDYVKVLFESNRTYGLFTLYFDAEIYSYAAKFYETHTFGRFRRTYSLWGVAEVIEKVEISRLNHLPHNELQHFLEQDFAIVHKTDPVPDNFKPYITARVDLKLNSTEGDFQIQSVSDDKATVNKPAWFQKNGIGYVIQSYAGKLKIVAKASVSGQIALQLKSMDIRDAEGKRIPYWIDYTRLAVNDKVLLDILKPIWHDKGYNSDITVKADEEFTIEVEWLPHRSDT